MLILTCALCEKNSHYSAEELFGRYFMCKCCHWLNLLDQGRVVSLENSTRSLATAICAHTGTRHATTSLCEGPSRPASQLG